MSASAAPRSAPNTFPGGCLRPLKLANIGSHASNCMLLCAEGAPEAGRPHHPLPPCRLPPCSGHRSSCDGAGPQRTLQPAAAAAAAAAQAAAVILLLQLNCWQRVRDAFMGGRRGTSTQEALWAWPAAPCSCSSCSCCQRDRLGRRWKLGQHGRCEWRGLDSCSRLHQRSRRQRIR